MMDAGSISAADITESVIRRFDGCRDPRLREIMQAFVAHLHGFITEVGLTPEEWTAAIRTLTATGEITDARRQEFILWSDTLGVSMLVDALANPLPAGATESTVLGPFYVPGSPLRAYGDTTGQPIAGAELDLWQNDADMLYAVQKQEGPEDHLRGRYRTREDGSFAFIAVRPVPYPIPNDGPVGRMLDATGRHPWRPAHIHAVIRAPGYRSVVTHLFDQESEYLDTDTVFAVKPSLLRKFEERSAEDPERPEGIAGEWVSLESDIVLVAGEGGAPIVDPGRTA